ncbi:metal-dependent hydrolase [Candidatus Halobonum tyrrellensis]|uniref:Membrane-bound metal-dependent hydrolase n=1 Tax=Candidatus Halobonum tyrrellensis G22 TaxID=1324957 RepID=V4HAP1_9EURY|nr:metal-dependent hydrolase [Candidatus Halobonum tyrrellensis]ESP87775.1 hypothetical protein K933_12301 [Candidatus Halobonum tyrrellensis G22]
MPSTLVHVALAGLFAAALLRERAFGRRSVAVVLLAATLPDLDAFASLVVGGAHRSLGHNALVPAALAAALLYDTRVGDSRVRARYGPTAPAVAWTALAGFAVAGVGLDYVVNGVNLFWPLHDQFYTLDGRLALSTRRGLVQTFVDLSVPAEAARTTENLHYSTGVDPSPGAEPGNVERVFPVVAAGWQFLVVLAGAATLAVRFRQSARAE